MEREPGEIAALEGCEGVAADENAALQYDALDAYDADFESGEFRQPSSLRLQVVDERIPLFLLKLWSILGDSRFRHIIRWDGSGYSFHIDNPQLFCREVLPLYYKHNNLNSFVRQLNMYGFRKITSIDRTSLIRTEGDQDHLEFSHPCFLRGHPELLMKIKRKTPIKSQNPNIPSMPSQDMSVLIDEIKKLHENQRVMENKLATLVKENESVWQQLTHLRSAHAKQQQVVNKLVQFFVALMQPSQKRLGKRNLLAIDERSLKRARMDNSTPTTLQTSSNHLSEVLDRLQQELSEGIVNQGIQRLVAARNSQTNGPIIADVTEELETRPLETVHTVPQSGLNHCQSVTPPTRTVEKPSTNQTPSFSVTSPETFSPVEKDLSSGTSALSTSATLTLSPSIDRQICDELTEFLTGQEHAIEGFRELLGDTWDSITDCEFEDEEAQRQQRHHQLMLESAVPLLSSGDVIPASTMPVDSNQSLSLHLAERLAAGSERVDSDSLIRTDRNHLHGVGSSGTQVSNDDPVQLNGNATHRLGCSPPRMLNDNPASYLNSSNTTPLYLSPPASSQSSDLRNYSTCRGRHRPR